MNALLVALGAALGACARYLTDVAAKARWAGDWPWGTLLVNVIGAGILGAASASLHGDGLLLVGTGFCGALTTVSTFSWETLSLGRAALVRGGAYAAVSVALAVAAAWVGAALAGG